MCRGDSCQYRNSWSQITFSLPLWVSAVVRLVKHLNTLCKKNVLIKSQRNGMGTFPVRLLWNLKAWGEVIPTIGSRCIFIQDFHPYKIGCLMAVTDDLKVGYALGKLFRKLSAVSKLTLGSQVLRLENNLSMSSWVWPTGRKERYTASNHPQWINKAQKYIVYWFLFSFQQLSAWMCRVGALMFFTLEKTE